MRSQAIRLGRDQATIDATMEAITNIPGLNKYANERACALLELADDTNPDDLEADLQQRYWDAYALWSKELVTAAIAQL